MTTRPPDVPPTEDRHARLERQFIDEYLSLRGHTREDLQRLPQEEADALLREASVHASSKLAEVDSRAHFVHEIHGETTGGHKPPGT